MIISIDPGINNCGLSVIDIAQQFTVKESILVKGARKFTEPEKAVEVVYGNRTVKVQAILAKIEELLVKYPDVTMFSIEAPFYNSLTPMAYGSLLEVIMAIKYACIIKHKLQFKLIEPMLVKKFFAKNHMAKKEHMRQFLISRIANGDIVMVPGIEVDNMSEHEIDSVAVGFVYHLGVKEKEAEAAQP